MYCTTDGGCSFSCHSEMRSGVEGIEGLAGIAAQRALDLRDLTAKRARPLKKKALTDFLKALMALGASRNRAAVPAERRGAQSWFAQVLFTA